MVQSIDNRKKIHINVLNYNTYESTKRCIDSCLNQTGVEFRILLIDNASTDGSFEMLQNEYGDSIDYLKNPDNFGYAKANNIGIRRNIEVGGDYTFILNSDIELANQFILVQLYYLICKHPNSGIVAPIIKTIEEDNEFVVSNKSFYISMLGKLGVLPSYKSCENLMSFFELQGSAMMVNNSFFDEVGGFPEHYYMYAEESTLCKKLLWEGHPLYRTCERQCFVYHHHPISTGRMAWREFITGRNKAIEYYENRHVARKRWMIVFFLFEIKMVISRRFDLLKGIKHGLTECTNMTLEELYEEGKRIVAERNQSF